MSPRRHGPTGPFARFAHLFSAAATAGRKPRRSRSLAAHLALRLESLESRAMLSSAPFIAELPQDLAGKTTSLVTVHGRYGNNAGNGDWELGITSNTSAPPQKQVDRIWKSSARESFTFEITKIPASLVSPAATSGDFTIGGSNVKASYTDIASYEPNAIKIWARSTTTGSGLTINDLKIKTPGVAGETAFPGTVINVSQDLGPVFQEIIIAGIDFKPIPSGSVTLEGTVAMQFGNAPTPRGSSVQFHVIATHIPWVDLDVDSNNNGSIDLTNGRRGTDDPIEQAAPGKIIPVGGDRAEMLVTLPAGRNATLEIDAAAADKIRVHTHPDQNTSLTLTRTAPNSLATLDLAFVPPTNSTPTLNTWRLWVEAVAPSTTAGDIVLTLTGDDSGPPDQDVIRATAATVDLSIDGLPADIEDGSGAIIWRNSDFSRRILDTRQPEPGVPRYQPDYRNTDAIDPAFDAQFTKARATFTTGMAAGYEFRFGFQPAVTLWTRTEWKGFVAAADGWWKIPSGKNVGPRKITDDALDFWVEGLETTVYAEEAITFESISLAPPPNGRARRLLPADTANFTVIDAGIGVDGNRDGTIDFTDSYDRQLTFWLNEDRETESYVDPSAWFNSAMFETENASGAGPTDSADEFIRAKRDLEDMAAIHLQVDPVLQGARSPFTRSFDRVQSPRADKPLVRFDLSLNTASTALRLFRAADASTLAHVQQPDSAAMQIGNARFRYNAEDSLTTGISRGEPALVGDLTLHSAFDITKRSERPEFLFEAFGQPVNTTLTFTVTVTYPRQTGSNGRPRTTSRSHDLALDLRSIEEFYTRMRIPYRHGDRDGRFTHFTPGTTDLPHFAAAQPLFTGKTGDMPFLSGTDTVVLVHGWNMTDGTQTSGPSSDWKKAFAETAFKRLYWQGFRGQFTAFDSPTFADTEGPIQDVDPWIIDHWYPGAMVELAFLNFTYNASEYQAFRSGRSLMTFLADKKATGPVHLLAHSLPS